MKSISLEKYSPIISDKGIGEEIYKTIKDALSTGKVTIDFSTIKSMATFNAKQIFGRLYLELGPEAFFDNIRIDNTSQDLKIIIKMGIQSALDEQSAKNQ